MTISEAQRSLLYVYLYHVTAFNNNNIKKNVVGSWWSICSCDFVHRK